ncbi:MAG TPA: translocation/assembly module TamB domain-containing protein [Thermoanaerobaculia bacterium]|nr:translocation/assembly module TamB domain-containing protein [Thermoanaerobaculia bacterium]
MDEQPIRSDTLFPHETGHHRSARERQRKGPMWGCLRLMMTFFIVLIALGILLVFVAPWALQTTITTNYIARRVEQTLEARLGREVTIGRVQILRTTLFEPTKIILHDVRIANAPGGVSPFFAHVDRVEISGGIGSLRTRTLDVSRIDIINPKINFEVFPQGAALTHNFPKWSRAPRRRYEIYRMAFDRMFIRGGNFLFLDRRHDIAAEASAIAADLTITSRENLYAGIMQSPRFVFRLQDYEPVEMNLRGGFRYTPGVLLLESIALRGRGVEAFVSGKLDPLTEAVYDLRVRSNISLERVREVFRVSQTLAGTLSLDTNLRGRSGDFRLTGGWVSNAITADAYDLADAKGTLDVTGERTLLNVERARYGGGTISADYRLTQYAEPYPMTVDLRYNGISIEQLFADWGVENTGLRGAATGALTYRWNKDAILAGAGRGSARLARNAVAFSDARYPIPLAGATDFELNNGVVLFRNAQLETPASRIALDGSLRIEGVVTDLRVRINSDDFSELDRAAYNFAHSAGKRDYELLGLGGSGEITGSVRGPIEAPQVVARIAGRGTKYNDVLLGASDIELRYDGARSVLTFDRAVFTDGAGRLALKGTIAFPDRGPGPRFDLAVEAAGYPVDRAIKAVDLDFTVGGGAATGSLVVTGTPESGTVRFANLLIRREDSDLRLNGDIAWLPGEGNVRFNLDIAAREFPVADILAFLDLGTLPVTGQLTGTLHIEGPKTALEGAGSITVRRGTIFGEPVDTASADIVFDRGRMRATAVSISAPAGQITGEAEYDFATERFTYTIASTSIDLSRLKALESLQSLFGGRLAITSSGAGTMDNPELVVEARLLDAAFQGLDLPEGAPPPTFYLAIRGGRLIIRGSIADILTIEGDGIVGEGLTVDGNVRITVTDIARLVALSPNTASLPAAGNAVIDLKLGGRLSPFDQLVVEATVPTLDFRFSGEQFTPRAPLRLTLRQGRLTFDQFELLHTDSAFAVTGSAEVMGDRRLNVDVSGSIAAALLQLFMPDVRADGRLNVAAGIRGTMAKPVIRGTGDLVDAQVKFAGFPQLIDEINGTLEFEENLVRIQSLRATIGGGTVTAGGSINLDGLTPQSVNITLVGDNVALRYYEGLTIQGNFELRVAGDAERSVVQGDISVTRAVYSRDFDLQQSILNVVLSRRGLVPVVAADWQERVQLRIHIDAPDTLAVRNNIAEATGSADLDVMGTLANPVILGTVELDEGGKVTFQGIDYRLVRGTINFQNPFRIDPYFDVTFEGRVSGNLSELESGPIDLTVNITGTLDRISPSITSDPPASDITLFSLLGFGELTRRGSGGGVSSANAAVLGQSLVAQSLISALGSRILPFADSFTYDPGLLDTGSGAGPKVTFEKRVRDDLRLLVVYNLDSHKSREVIEWQVTRDWTLQITRDESESEYRAEGRFRRRYRGHWTWGQRGRGEDFFPMESIADSLADIEIAPLPPPTRVTNVPPDTVAREIDIRADGTFDTAALREHITLQPGQPVTKRALQSSIKALYGTGNFRDIRVESEPAPEGGVNLTFALSVNYRIGSIGLEGVGGGNRRRAERRMRVRVGEVLSLNEVDDTAVAIQEELRLYGYLEAVVDPETRFTRERNLADVVFHVTLGPEAKVGSLDIVGDLAPFTEAEIIKEMRQKPGRSYRLPDAREDVNRVRRFLFGRDHRRAEVELVSNTYDPETDMVALQYRVDAGPLVKIEVAGVPRRAVRRQLPFRDRDEEYSEDAIQQAAENMVDAYQERGYYNVTVDTESTRDNGTWTTTFHVDPGLRYRLTDVTFTGNTKVSDDELEATVATTPSGGFRRLLARLFRRPTGVTREQLSEDRDAIESQYRLEGFTQATVGTPVVTTRADGTMEIDFPIVEGPQTLVTAVEVEGLEQVERDDLPSFQLQPGEPLNPQLLREDIVALQTFYANRGNAEVQITSREDISEDMTAASVTYVVAEGPRIDVGEVIVRGNTYTNSEVVLRTAGLDEGEPFTYTSILEAQQNLYRLGTFQRVDVQPDATGTSVDERNVVISVEEGRNLTVSGSAGARFDSSSDDSDDEDKRSRVAPRLAAAAAHRNLFGTGRFLGVEAVWSEDEQEAFITYREPFIGRYDVPVQFNLFQTDDGTVKERVVRQRGASIEASKIARARTRWSLQYQYKISECVQGALCERAGQIFVPGLDPSLLDIEISSITPTFFWDRRDDIIDPHRGFFTSASVEYAFPLFSAETNFMKEFVQGAWYIPVSTRSVIALSGRMGWIQPLRKDDPTTPLDESRFVPVAERFTAGGDTSHRAYPLDLLGTLCEGEVDPEPGCESTLFNLAREGDAYRLAPLGGNSLFIMNAEYRFPIFSSLGGAVFADIGNVFSSPSIQFDDLRLGVGAGIRYLSPVGPLRIDIGWPLDRRPYDRTFNYSITLGYAF